MCPMPQSRLVGVRISYIFIFPGHPEFWTPLQTLLCGGPWMYPVTALLGWEVWPTRKVLDYTVNYPPECLDHRCIKVLTFQLLTQIVCSSHRVYKCSWNLHIILGEAPLLICEPSADNILITHCDWDETNSHGLLSPVEEKGQQGHSLSERGPQPMLWQAFISFLGTLHWGWSSFTMHRFTLGDYILQKTKERMLLNTSEKKDICKCKGKIGWTGYTHPWKV